MSTRAWCRRFGEMIEKTAVRMEETIAGIEKPVRRCVKSRGDDCSPRMTPNGA